MRNATTLVTIALTGALGFAGTAVAQQEGEILIGTQCDRTGPTQIVGIRICPAFQDYVNLINSKGGIEGFKIVAPEIDNEYKVPPAVEAYERQKQQGAVTKTFQITPHFLRSNHSAARRPSRARKIMGMSHRSRVSRTVMPASE